MAETRVVVEGWSNKDGWHSGGLYDLTDPAQVTQAQKKVKELSSQYSPVRCRSLYQGGEVDLSAAGHH